MMVFLPRRNLFGRYLQPALSGICFLLLSFMAWGTATNKTTEAPPVATGTINHPISLSPYLVPIAPPSGSLLQTESEPERYLWYQLNLVLSPDFSTDWLLVFSRIPHSVLDIYLPENNLSPNKQYEIKRMGVDSLSASTPDTRTIRLPLTNGQTHRLLLKVSSQSSRNLSPELWPASLYSLSEYRYHALSASLQTIMLAMLGAALAAALIKKTCLYLPLVAHLSSISLLLVALNGSLFRLIPYNVDPGQLVAIVTILTMLSALACYLNLFRVTRLTPKNTMTLSGATLVASGLMFGFVFAADNTVPSLPLVLLLCLQSISLTLLHYLLQPGQKKQPFTVNLIKGTESQRRRVFSQHFRESLLQLNQQNDNNELTEQILDIIDATLDKTPAVLLQHENNEWQLSSYSAKAKQQIDRELEQFVSPLTQLLGHDSDDQVHFQDKQGNSFWGFHLNDDAECQLFLVLFPGKYQRETITRQQALDLCSHIKTILKANQQTRFWQLQASLDPLTGLLNRNRFFQEAEQQIEACKQQQLPCCLLFVDIDDFKRINDQFGHPAGDRILVEIAHQIRDSLRQQDLIARYGGEEFVILLPVTSAWQGTRIAERVRIRVHQYNASPLPVTLSMGLSAMTGETDSLNQLINEADNAMYTAKKHGKNRLEAGPSCSDLRLSWPEG